MDDTLPTPQTPSTDPVNAPSPASSAVVSDEGGPKPDDVGFTIEKQLEEKLEAKPPSLATPTLDSPVPQSVDIPQVPLPTVSEPGSTTSPAIASLPDLENPVAPSGAPASPSTDSGQASSISSVNVSPSVSSSVTPSEGGSPSPSSPSVSFAEEPSIKPPSNKESVPQEKKSSKGGAGKKLVAGIAALVLLVVALGAGLYSLGVPGAGEIRRKAEVCTSDSRPANSTICETCGWENQGQCGVGDSDTCNCNPGNSPCDLGFESNGAGGCRVPVLPTPPGGGLTGSCPPDPVVWCATFDCPNGDTDGDGTCNPTPHDGFSGDTGATYTVQPGSGCSQPGSGCGQVDKYNSGTPGIDWNAYCGHSFINFTNCQATVPTATPTNPPGATATPTETSSLQCVDVRVQMQENGAWVDVPNNDLSAVGRPNDLVRFVARISTNLASGYAVGFSITFDGTTQTLSGTLLPDPNPTDQIKEYAVTYTIPAAGTLSVTATIAVP